MNTEIIVALITLAGSIIGTLGGILVTQRLVDYRLKQLEKKVDKHNNVIQRTFVLEEQIKVANHRLDDLERHEEQRRSK